MGHNPINDFSLRRWLRVGKRVVRSIGEQDLGLISAGVAFFGFLSIFPALAAAVSIWGLFSEPATIESGLSTYGGAIPGDAVGLLRDRLNEITASPQNTLGLAGLAAIVFALLGARMGAAALETGLNRVYRERSSRNPIKAALRALILTVLLIVTALVAISTAIIVPALFAFVHAGVGAGSVEQAVQWLVFSGVTFFALIAIYRYVPARVEARLGWLVPGAALALVCWAAATYAMSIYFTNLANLSAIYGSIGAAIALMLWLFVSAFSVLLGALLNAELELETSRDSTIPPEKPMGQRGAFVADTTSSQLGKKRQRRESGYRT